MDELVTVPALVANGWAESAMAVLAEDFAETAPDKLS